MELLIGGLAATGAGFFSNPLEVVKTRMQLQGELKSRGKYTVHYKNVFHAAYVIGSKEGILALQKGLIPALNYQFLMNGTRLGTYQLAEKYGLTKNKDGNVSAFGSFCCGAMSGAMGAIVGSPFYMIKTQLQARSNNPSIAVGDQHQIQSVFGKLSSIFREHGFKGLWRGTCSQIPRVTVGSSVQFLTFETSLEFVTNLHLFKKGSWLNTFIASLYSGVFVAICMAPFDLVATRIYNQTTNSQGIGLKYSSWLDCVKKIHVEEGILKISNFKIESKLSNAFLHLGVYGFFKGWTANYFRIGPHCVLLLLFWDRLKKFHKSFNDNEISAGSEL